MMPIENSPRSNPGQLLPIMHGRDDKAGSITNPRYIVRRRRLGNRATRRAGEVIGARTKSRPA